jgi:hypothetical protein
MRIWWSRRGPIPVFQVFTHAIWAPTCVIYKLLEASRVLLDVVITFSFPTRMVAM